MFKFGSARNLFQRDRRLHFAGQIRIVEFVRVANPFVRSQFDVRPAEGMALARGEIRERHFVTAANFGVHLMHLGGESVRRKPFGHRVGIEKCLVNLFGRRSEDAVKSNSICCHNLSLFRLFGVCIRLDNSKDVAGRICGVSEPANLWNRHFRNADFSTALLDFLHCLIKRLDGYGV